MNVICQLLENLSVQIALEIEVFFFKKEKKENLPPLYLVSFKKYFPCSFNSKLE